MEMILLMSNDTSLNLTTIGNSAELVGIDGSHFLREDLGLE